MKFRRAGIRTVRRALTSVLAPPTSVVGFSGMMNAAFRAAALAAVEPALDHLEAGTAPSRRQPGQFLGYPVAGPLGSLESKLYIPGSTGQVKPGLIVMLHGCSQSPDAFARGTRMNQLAEQRGFLVLYPEQGRRANPAKCWNWFRTENQRRDSGEPGLIAEATHHVMAEFDVDPRRVFVAGLSAGGAMAATMIELYPELYGAAGIHSGLPARAAHNVTSAMRAMESGSSAVTPLFHLDGALPRPMILFQGDADSTVHPANAEALLAPHLGTRSTVTEATSEVNGRKVVLRTVSRGADVVAELWSLKGAGHAWSGGDRDGSYTDTTGPDASAEMLRFFGTHPLPR